jgi:hypothetical protein
MRQSLLTLSLTFLAATSAQAFDIGGMISGAVQNAVTNAAKEVATDTAKTTAKEVAKANGVEGADKIIDTAVDVAADPQAGAKVQALQNSNGVGRAFIAANLAVDAAVNAGKPKPTAEQVARGDFNADDTVDANEAALLKRANVQYQVSTCGGQAACVDALVGKWTQDLAHQAANTAANAAVKATTDAAAAAIEPAAGK